MFIVTKTINSDNIGKVCRTCLREDGEKMVYLFIGSSGSSLATKLQSLSCLEITQGDGLPEKMCNRCVTRAESALLFREQCRAADQALRKAAAKIHKKSSQNYYEKNNSIGAYSHFSNITRYNSYEPLLTREKILIPNQFYSSYGDEEWVHHMHVVEPRNVFPSVSSYFSSHYEYDSSKTVLNNQQNSLESTMINSTPDKTSCALYCPSCNHTFQDKSQLTTHNCSPPMDCNSTLIHDESNVDVEENSNPAEKNLIYPEAIHQSVNDYSFSKIYQDNNRINSTKLDHKIDKNHSIQSDSISIISFEERITPAGIQNKISSDVEHKNIENEISQRAIVEMQASENSKPFKCIHCEKSYLSKNKLRAHTRLHTKINIHQCHLCQKIFSYPSYLTDHMKTHNSNLEEKKIYNCTNCGKDFQFLKSYKRHMKLHSGKDLYNCDVCDKKFTHKYSLKVHILCHSQSRVHECKFCHKSFNQKCNLIEHMRTHTKSKPFKCSLCDKSFTQSSHLKSHEASHNSNRQHQCRICGKSFKLPNHLKRHYNLHIGSKLYKCDQCGQFFSQAFSLKRHSKKHAES